MNRWHRLSVPTLALALVLAACSSGNSASPSATTGGGGGGASQPASSGGGGGQIGGEVTVIGTWGGDEEKAFLQMVKPFEDQTGVKVKYTGTRDLNTVLTTGVASGVLPDLAGLPGPGQMQQFAQAGALKPLDDVLDIQNYKDQTAPALVQLGTVNDQVVGVFIKTAIKGLMWYDPKVVDYSNAPKTWDDLQAALKANASKADKPWCLGIESGAASGWPATDWIEDILLRQAGPDKYADWYNGKLKWTSPEVKQAFQTYGEVVANSYGGANTVVTTNFANAGDPLFKSPPGCQLLHQASFITGLGAFPKQKAGEDYDFFPFPDINSQFSGAVEGAGDLFGMFHDTPQAKALIKYLVTPEAQSIWVGIGGALSANKQVTNYPDDISKRSAELLTNAKIFVFDASDLMPTDMNDAFWKAVVAYTQHPDQLDSLLANLDKTQADAYAQ
jgi:alpha-glucoside transport system substrate-binding protein